MNKTLIVIVGPTAIGKTALSIQLAQHFQTEILSTDSRQIFKEMTIGTAVPSKTELKAAPHHLIQTKSIFDNYSVGDFEKESLAILDDLFLKNDVVVAVGGSGLYVNALLFGLDDFPEIKPGIRAEIIANYQKNGLIYFQNELKKLDHDYYHHILKHNPQTLQNPQRLMRFLEVCISSGQPYSSFINKYKVKRDFTPIIIGLTASREFLYERINHRVDLMMQVGLLNEAQKLLPYKQFNALQTVGYRELFDYFEDKCSLDEAIDKIKQNTRNFAKRQLTWFKKNENVKWFDYQEDLSIIVEHVESKITL